MPLTSDLQQSDPTVGTLDNAVPHIDARQLLSTDATERRQIVDALRLACVDTGFFYLANAFADPSTYLSVQKQMQRFFELPDNDPLKQAVKASDWADAQGWTPMFGEPSYQPGTVAHMESFDCGVDDSKNASPHLPNFRRDVCNYRTTLTTIANAVLEALAEAAGIDRTFFADRCNTQELNTLRLLHYPENDAPATQENVGISAHTDFECITFISQTAPGLELTDVNGNWYDAPCDDGRIVVLLDDMLERWTNGYYKATGHRVRNTPWNRYSTVIFFAVNDDELIAPLPAFVDDDRPPGYAPVTQRKHLDAEVSRAVKNRATT